MTTVVFRGEAGVSTYRAIALKHGLALYLRTGMKPNSAWTLSNMLKAASSITGLNYTRKQGADAVADLDAWIKLHGTTGAE